MSTEHKDHIIKGMACAATAYFMLSMMMVFSKLLSQTHSVIEVSFYRNLIAVLPLLFLIFIMGKHDIMKIRSNPKILILRGVIGTFGMFLTFGAFSLLPLADATVLLFSSSIFLPILSYFFLKESISRARWSAIACGGICAMFGADLACMLRSDVLIRPGTATAEQQDSDCFLDCAQHNLVVHKLGACSAGSTSCIVQFVLLQVFNSIGGPGPQKVLWM